MNLEADIGMCDDCGSEDGERHAWRRFVSVPGESKAVTVWLCKDCW